MPDEPRPIPGQLDVYECIDEVEKAKATPNADRVHVTVTTQPVPKTLTPAQIVALRMKEK